MQLFQIFFNLSHWLAEPETGISRPDDPLGHPCLAGMTQADLADLPLPRLEREVGAFKENRPAPARCA